jgi:hypothetical protein
VKVPGGLAFSEFRGYEAWHAVSISRNAKVVAVILGNPVMIDAYVRHLGETTRKSEQVIASIYTCARAQTVMSEESAARQRNRGLRKICNCWLARSTSRKEVEP